jgi:hypothetical protein
MGRGGLAKGGKESVNQSAVCEEFLSAPGAKREEVFVEADVRSWAKAVGGTSKIGHRVVRRMGTIAQAGRDGEKKLKQRKMAT